MIIRKAIVELSLSFSQPVNPFDYLDLHQDSHISE